MNIPAWWLVALNRGARVKITISDDFEWPDATVSRCLEWRDKDNRLHQRRLVTLDRQVGGGFDWNFALSQLVPSCAAKALAEEDSAK